MNLLCHVPCVIKSIFRLQQPCTTLHYVESGWSWLRSVGYSDSAADRAISTLRGRTLEKNMWHVITHSSFLYTDDSGNVNNFISEVFVCLRSSFNSFIGAGSVEVSVCPEYPVLTRVFCICSSARPSSTSSCSAPWNVAWSCTWPSSCISELAPAAAWFRQFRPRHTRTICSVALYPAGLGRHH